MNFLKIIREELKYEIMGIILLALALLGLTSFYNSSLGAVGNFIGRVLKGVCGEGRVIFPILLGVLGIRLILQRGRSQVTSKVYGGILLFIIILTILHIQLPVEQAFALGYKGVGGGLIGALLSYLLLLAFGRIGAYIILTALSLVALLLLTNKSLAGIIGGILTSVQKSLYNFKELLVNFLFTEAGEDDSGKKQKSLEFEQGTISRDDIFISEGSQPEEDNENEILRNADINPPAGSLPVIEVTPEKEEEIYHDSNEVKAVEESWNESKKTVNYTPLSIEDVPSFQLPPLTLLARPNRGKGNKNTKDVSGQVKILEETLASFGIKAKVTQVSRGPAITRFEVQPPIGVKVSRILSLADDIALSMAAQDVRIEAPVPGKSVIGIEVPNKEVSMVHFRELLESREFVQSPSRLTIALGKDIAGNSIVADLSKMPHLLIAGATGAGKSVCLNTLIASILFKATPDEVKLLMIDPKMVELATYNGIPHLVSPVVTNAKKAATSLRWAVKEMEKRYNLFAEAGVRDITRYNNIVKTQSSPGGEEKKLPYIVVIIDELADLMMVAPSDVEDAVCRLAQMARAAGIHLVIATQRPSVDVITGLIKANIPSRISFAVSSQVDSRTILDMAGAEKLLGKGDMLFYPVGASKPVRVQGAYLSDKEVDELVKFLKKQAKPVYNEKVTKEEPKESEQPVMEDELLPKAALILIEQGQASISMLQRRLHIGYARAARLIDIMEQRGIVGGYEGSKPRAVLMTMEQYNEVFKKEAPRG
ncbi:S-DNA-T family DNA segregation ATPase FtsK/SpoIIIE [Desulfohalotomaculum tongense]|uniref:DNA translocase FtsK n=1 Tax=Desulforadius tongensis TaxID=1216062 RepID=UPI001EE51F5A|nr:DNA translocase FtsK [Desulforadius tongensis]MBM7854466.1 S-DNA-T family DNA segregation ATPase FtsK/SpoIIIE [Desulforadius tongensis]